MNGASTMKSFKLNGATVHVATDGTMRSAIFGNGHAAMPVRAGDPIQRTPVTPQAEAPRHRVVAPPAPEPVSLRPKPEVQAEPEPVAETPAVAPSVAALEDRVAQLETRLEQQEAALRRVLTLLVEWSEIDNRDGDARREDVSTIRPGAWGHAA